jgi:hypothetical protein
MGEGRAREGGTSALSWFDWFIFAFQTSFCTSVALGTLLVAFLLLWSVSKGGALEPHLHVYLFFARSEQS